METLPNEQEIHQVKKENLLESLQKTELESYLQNLYTSIENIIAKLTITFNDGVADKEIKTEINLDPEISMELIADKLANQFSEQTIEKFSISAEFEGDRKDGGESWSGFKEF